MSALIGVLALSGALWSAPSADAASYRYWSYWLGTDAGWSYSSWGPASLRPEDGSVEGWRFGVGEGTGGVGLAPRSAPDFDQVCAGTQPAEDRKRVAIVIDPGLAEHAPAGESPRGAWAMCVSALPAATGFDILRAAASVRTQSGMVCGLAGYPARECAVIVAAPEPDPVASPAPERNPVDRPARPSRPSSEGGAQSDSQSAAQSGTKSSTQSGTQAGAGAGAGSAGASTDGVATGAPGGADRTSSTGGDPNPVARDGAQQEGRDGTQAGAPDSGGPSPSPGSSPGSSSSGAPALAGTGADPQLTIVSAAVTDPASGPGPIAAIIAGAAIALLAAAAFLRRRATRSG